MKKIKIKFVDFWTSFNIETLFLYKILSKHYIVELSDDPDYIFYSVFGSEHLQFGKCVKILYTGENICPDFNLCDYAIGFEYINYEDRYFRFSNMYDTIYWDDFQKMVKKIEFTKDLLIQKEGFCSFVYSNDKADKFRTELYEAIGKIGEIHSGGKYLNNVGGRVANKIEFQSKYKFCIACENSSHSGYTTEKLLQAFASQTIPIYWGDPRVGEVFNEKSFINCHVYSSIEEIIEIINEINNDDTLYMQMMSTPAILNQKDNLQEKYVELESFIRHIFEQPLEQAKRYNRVFFGEKYLRWQKCGGTVNIVIGRLRKKKRILKKFLGMR